MLVTAVLVDCNNEVVGARPLCGSKYLLPVYPSRRVDLNVKSAHRDDLVVRVFELDGRATDNVTYIYRERYWSLDWCPCVDGFLPRL